MKALFVIIGGLLVLSLVLFSWLKIARNRKIQAAMNAGRKIAADPMRSAMNPKNPLASAANGANAAARNFIPAAIHNQMVGSNSPGSEPRRA